MARGFAAFYLIGALLLAGLAAWQSVRGFGRAERIEIAAERLAEPPGALPATPDPELHALLPVRLHGRFDHGGEQRVYGVLPPWGAGAHLLTPVDLENGRRVLVERGFLPNQIPSGVEKAGLRPVGDVQLEGVLAWPRERGWFTPEPDGNLWFARDIPALAAVTGAEPFLVRAAPIPGQDWPRAERAEADHTNIHVGYALTWAGMLVAWLFIGALAAPKRARCPD